MGAQLPPSDVGEPTPLKVVLGFRLLKSPTPGTGAQEPNDTPLLPGVNRDDLKLFYISTGYSSTRSKSLRMTAFRGAQR
jgi:hypothetical protein